MNPNSIKLFDGLIVKRLGYSYDLGYVDYEVIVAGRMYGWKKGEHSNMEKMFRDIELIPLSEEEIEKLMLDVL